MQIMPHYLQCWERQLQIITLLSICKLLPYYQYYFSIADYQKKVWTLTLKVKKIANIILVCRECLALSHDMPTIVLLSIMKEE